MQDKFLYGVIIISLGTNIYFIKKIKQLELDFKLHNESNSKILNELRRVIFNDINN